MEVVCALRQINLGGNRRGVPCHRLGRQRSAPEPRVRVLSKMLGWALEHRRWDLSWSRARCVQRRTVVTMRALAVGSSSHAAHY
jgi:hypothetical protein